LDIAGADTRSGRITFDSVDRRFLVLIRFAALDGVFRPVIEKLVGEAEKPVDILGRARIACDHLNLLV
jgi:hypothetical protein